MKKPILLLAFSLSAAYLFAQETCENAFPITQGLYTVDEVAGTDTPLPVCTGNTPGTKGEWYSYTAPFDASVVVSTNLPQNFGRDTRIQIYSGTCENRVCVGGNDDISGSNWLSLANFSAAEGETYYIAFDDRWETNGFDFTLSENSTELLPLSFSQQTITTTGSTMGVVDMNGDFLDDIVAVSSTTININYQQANGSFQFVTFGNPQVQHSASWSLAAGDIDRNGYNDLLYGGGSGVTFMLANEGGFGYTEVSGPEYVFSQRSNFVDINNDGHLDAFVCHDVNPNVYYLNDGNNNLIFHQGGLGDTFDGGNYGSLWSDFDNDGDLDLFVSKCKGNTQSTSNINQFLVNNGDGTFTEIAEELNLADNVQTWSSAVGDFDNDGDMDIFVGASSMANGSHKLMINDGTGSFTDQTAGTGLENFMATNIETRTHDFNNDGYLDIFAGGSVILLGSADLTFTPVPIPAGHGPIGDVNNDGFLDIVYNSTIYLNDGNDNNYIKIHTIGAQSNINGIGARIEVYTANLGKQIRDVRSGDGFRHMSSLTAHFGIGQETAIDSVVVNWPSGIVDVYENPDINTTIISNEGETDLSVGLSEAFLPELAIFPNPVRTDLIIEAPVNISGSLIRIFDVAGKKVMEGRLNQNQIDVSNFKPGAYVLQLDLDGKSLQRKFVKQ